jgi:pimeloyl-ACP methyl ester carboxylesterase
MARIVCVHGIAQELKSRESLLAEWVPSLRGGVSNAGSHIDESDVDMAFYGLLFRPSDAKGGADVAVGLPNYTAGDLRDPLELALLSDMFDEVAEVAVETTDAKSGLPIRSVHRMLQVVAAVPYFGRKTQSLVIWFLHQVRRYFRDPEVRSAAQRALIDRIADDTCVIVAHSLGTVVAYETLCAGQAPGVRTLITMGSPLGMPALLSRFKPPTVPGTTTAPSGIERWVNIADASDIVALRKELGPIYGDRVSDHRVYNGATMHDVLPYLTAPETGAAIVEALR